MAEDSLFSVVRELLARREAASGDQFHLVREYRGQDASCVDWSELNLPAPVSRALHAEFPGGLYRHQAQAVDESFRGHDVVVATRTSSGKSLIYTIPIASAILKADESTALLFFPTKALTNDQFKAIQNRIPAILTAAGRTFQPGLVARYDGGTPHEEREAARIQAQVLLTNPDMAHLSLLAWHERHWQRFLKNLKYIVLDEAHEYRGTFGTNVSMLLRRLLLLCDRYGSQPQFIATSATVASPADHLRQLVGRDFSVVPPEADGSRQGPKQFWIARTKGHPFGTARALMETLVEADKSVIAFCLSRWSTEENAEQFRGAAGDRVCVYRAGLRAAERMEIEDGLRTGRIKGVWSTSALELGIDIGLLDVCICIGLPGTMMSLWQRAGRVGRAGRAGVVILLPEARPIDAYFAEHPEELFQRPHEPLAINMNSCSLAKWHYACALKEAGGDFDLVPPDQLGEPLATIAREHQSGALDDTIFHSEEPHREYDIRAGGDSVYTLVDGKDLPVGQISRSQIAMEAAPNAIYRHNGRRYRVVHVQDTCNRIRLRPEYSPNRTRAFVSRKIHVVHCCGSKRSAAMQLEQCDRLRVLERLVNLTETSPDGTLLRTYNGTQGLKPFILPTSGVVLTVHGPAELVPQATRRDDVIVAKEGWNGLAPLLAGMLPSVLGPCDLSDFAIHSEWADRDAKLYIYDQAYDGIDLTLPVFDCLEKLLRESLTRIRECTCEAAEGCFRCVKHPYEDRTTNRQATRWMLEGLVDSLSSSPLDTTFRDARSTVLTDEASEHVPCKTCGQKNVLGARFCNNCGGRLEQ